MWVANVAKLQLSDEERKKVDQLIDDMYDKLDEGKCYDASSNGAILNFDYFLVAGQFLNSEGSGLFCTQSKLNHSCRPNAEVRFPYSNYIVAVTATREIQPGEEICISYLDDCFLERSRHTRQKYLAENYLFICKCIKCEEQVNDPDLTSEDEAGSGDEETGTNDDDNEKEE